MTFEERCRLSEQCLPEAPYRMLLTNLHNEMLRKLAEQPQQPPVAKPHEQEPDSTCNNTLRDQNKGYPRTCKKCGKGPCIADRVQPAQPHEQSVERVKPMYKYCADGKVIFTNPEILSRRPNKE